MNTELKSFATLENGLLLLFYFIGAVASIINLGVKAPIFIGALLLIIPMLGKPREAIVMLLMLFYLPKQSMHLPGVVIIATVLVFLFNIRSFFSIRGIKTCRYILLFFTLFCLWRFILNGSSNSTYNNDLYWDYFSLTLYSLVHLYVLSNLIRDIDDVKFISAWWIVIGVMASVLGLLHFLLADSVYLREIASYDTSFEMKGIIDVAVGWIRWIWVGLEPNFHGLHLLIPFGIATHYLYKTKSVWIAVACLMIFFGIFGTYSRSSFISAIAIFVFYSIYNKTRTKIIYFILIPVIAIGITYTYMPDLVERVYSIGENISSDGGSGRTDLAAETIDLFARNPITGVGTGQMQRFTKTQQDTHNTFIQILGENGILGFVFFSLIYLCAIYYSYRIRKVNPVFFATLLGLIMNLNTVSLFDLRVVLTFIVLITVSYYNRRRLT